jgi:hypothetical protein
MPPTRPRRAHHPDLDAGGAVASSEATEYGALRNIDNAQITAVADNPLVLDRSTGCLYLPGGKKVALSDPSGAKLQQSGPAASFRATATANALVKQPLDGSAATVTDLGAAGNPAPALLPVRRLDRLAEVRPGLRQPR